MMRRRGGIESEVHDKTEQLRHRRENAAAA